MFDKPAQTSRPSAAALPPRLVVSKLRRDYAAGETSITVLKDIDLTFEPGEMVAIVGASGSGKSTLMNLLGCLDQPTSGLYTIGGRSTSELLPDALAELRREHFGFIFQRYHLLPDLSALGNVEVPAVYAGLPAKARRIRALDLLKRLGMAERVQHRPGQLSGGQQQRVSIARALMNGGEIVLADEPTGALDSVSGEDVMRILKGLHKEGHTVIVVTHDMAVAEHCERVIEIKDGQIIGDRVGKGIGESQDQGLPAVDRSHRSGMAALSDSLREAFTMAVLSMRAHKMRTFLTMLGIIIGIASVVCVVALGAGSRQKVLESISAIGTNTLNIRAGSGFGDIRAGAVRTLNVADANAIAQQAYVDSVTPVVQTSVTVRYRNIAVNAQVSGVGAQYFRVTGLELAQGRFFDEKAVSTYNQNVVLDDNSVNTLFAGNKSAAIGAVILVGSVPARVIGVTKKAGMAFGGAGDTLSIFMPYTAVNSRMLGTTTLRSLTVRTNDKTDNALAEALVTKLLVGRHGAKDFFVVNYDTIRQTINTTTQTLTLLISAIAVISLVVGGIGVMNIMLVSVTERTGEIGVRMAVGARQRDIMEQFLIEAVLVCLIGGVMGILLALAFGGIFSLFSKDFKLIYSVSSIFWAFTCSTLIGIVFGFLPARAAARLDPVAALARE
ncbi:Macrolide export ATP-binding/permease protein MacB (plasmid) [Asticcacaulis sp. MM231]|uniref:MacB family efflux pump subunit n=1 Tax=Asticcacaulis sp. MM231 TaxID=3157666 RepID=UPI0032D57315